jgi:hypothetical protein
MVKRFVFPSLAILAAWTLIDAVAHRVLLQSMYALSPHLWRPFAEINNVLVVLATLILLLVFVLLFEVLVRPKALSTALLLGGLVGIALGTASGLGTYIHSPIPGALALAWSALGILKGLAAGAILGAFARGAASSSTRGT